MILYVGLGADDRQHVLAIFIGLGPAEALDLDQIRQVVWSRLGNGDQCRIGEHAIGWEFLLGAS